MNTQHLSSTLGTELDWVEEEYVSLNLGDKRLDKRLKKIVNVMTKRGGTSLPDIFGNWAGTKGAYRFFQIQKYLLIRYFLLIANPQRNEFKNKKQHWY